METITTIMQQTYPIHSIYVFDDGSSDTSAIEAVEAYKLTLGSEAEKFTFTSHLLMLEKNGSNLWD